MKRLLYAGGMVAAAVWTWFALSSARDLLSSERAAIETAWVSAGEALRIRSRILPELAAAGTASAGSLRRAEEALRTAKSRPEIRAASTIVDDAVGEWLVEVEGEPDRPAREKVKERLREVEIRFASERRKYNSAVQKYNVSLELFPNNLAARLFGFRREDGYLITEPPRH